MTSKYEFAALLRRSGYTNPVRELPITVYADTYDEATRFAEERLYVPGDYRYWEFRTEGITEVEPSAAPIKSVELGQGSLEKLAEIFSSGVEVSKGPTVNADRAHGCITAEDFQVKWIDRWYDREEYEAVCAFCGWTTGNSYESVTDVAAYEHAEKHVNEEKEHN